MAATFIKIATVTVGSGGASNIEFTSIPQTYTDLCCLLSARFSDSGTQATVWLQSINGNTSLSNQWMRGGDGTASTDASGGVYLGQVNASSSYANTFSNLEIMIGNYTTSGKKPINAMSAQEHEATTVYRSFTTGFWDNTAAVTSFILDPDGTNSFAQGTKAILYGIKKS